MKIEKKNAVKIALISLLIGVLLGAYITYAATPSSTFYLSPGVYPGAPSYTIWKEGSDYFAKDENGQLKYSGTNASAIVNSCIESLESEAYGYKAGIIHFNNGYYTFDSSIIVNKPNIILEGEGRSTELRPSSSSLDAIILIYTDADASTNTHATVIRNFIFYNPNWATYNDTVAIRYHNNISATYGISFPTVEKCWFLAIDGITTDTSGFTDWEHQLMTGSKILDCIFEKPPHFGIKLWNSIDGSIQNIFSTFEGTNTTGIELNYPHPLSTGIYFNGVTVLGATIGINFTGGAEGWFQSVVTDICTDYGFYIENCNRTYFTNCYASTNSTSQGSGFRLINSFKCRFESCTAVVCDYGFYSCGGSSSLFNYFIGTLSEGCGDDWYNIYEYDKFVACDYIIQNASSATISASTSVMVTHGLSGTPNVVTVTLGTTGAGDCYINTITSTQFTIHVANSGTYTVYWYACMSKHLP